jgi:hypothetical protein
MSSTSSRSKLCFVITPPTPELRDYAEQVFEFVVTEAVESFEYKPIRADYIADIGALAPQVIQHLMQDTLVIADLTGHHPQVIYGLAVRHAARRPVIHLIRSGEQSIFESPTIPTVHVSVGSARDAKRCKQELMSHIERLERDSTTQDTPISTALKRQLLEQSESLLDQRAADILKQVEAIQAVLSGIDERLAQPENILPAEHVTNAIKGSGMLLSREEIDRMMGDLFALAEDAKNALTGVVPELSAVSKGLYSTGAMLSDQNAQPDLPAISNRVEQYAANAMHSQNAASEAIQKLDGALSALSQLYRSLSKLTL